MTSQNKLSPQKKLASNSLKNLSFSQLGLCSELLQAIEETGYTEPTPVQQQAIPVINSGRDVMAGAQTGTGKTAAFALPILQKLSTQTLHPSKKRVIQTLILTPTRELATQVEENIKTYATHLPFKSAVIFGGVRIEAQIHKLERGFDILVATPGRLLDHLQRRTVDLSRVTTLVLDEADRMLDMGFIHDIKKIIQRLPKERQNLLFSATYSDEIKTLANQILVNPIQIDVAKRNSTAENIKQLVHPVERQLKRELLSYLIGSRNWQQVLVFVRTKHGADRLCKQLIADGLRTMAIHGDKTQGARKKALEEFKAGGARVLVATDIAARGIDISELPIVINYDLPDVPEDYVHRIGRTGRAGNDGVAITLVCEDDLKPLNAIESLLKGKLVHEQVEGFEIDLKYALQPKRVQAARASNGNRGPRKPARSGGSTEANPRGRTYSNAKPSRGGSRSEGLRGESKDSQSARSVTSRGESRDSQSARSVTSRGESRDSQSGRSVTSRAGKTTASPTGRKFAARTTSTSTPTRFKK